MVLSDGVLLYLLVYGFYLPFRPGMLYKGEAVLDPMLLADLVKGVLLYLGSFLLRQILVRVIHAIVC